MTGRFRRRARGCLGKDEVPAWLQEYREGVSVPQIAERYGVSESAIYYRLKRAGEAKRGIRGISREGEARLLHALYLREVEHLLFEDMGERLGVTRLGAQKMYDRARRRREGGWL